MTAPIEKMTTKEELLDRVQSKGWCARTLGEARAALWRLEPKIDREEAIRLSVALGHVELDHNGTTELNEVCEAIRKRWEEDRG